MADALTTQAVVLRRVPFGEADLIVTLMTRDAGKLSALARAARRSRRRFGAALEFGALSRVELGRRRGELWPLDGATLERYFEVGEVAALAHASYGAELVRELTAVEQPEVAAFDLLVELWRCLVEHGPSALVLRRFELKLLAALGLEPALAACAGCGDDELARAVLDPTRGALCVGCAAHARGAGIRPLGDAARRALVAAVSEPALAGARDDDGELGGELRAATSALIAHHVGKELRSVEFIGKVSAAARSGQPG